MKIDLMFHELTIEEAHRLSECAAEMLELIEEVAPPTPKRRRRTKAEMELARQAGAVVESPESEDHAEAEQEEPPTPRRRRKRAVDDTGDYVEPASPKRRRRAKATEEQDEISDADVAKAASEGAQRLTPKVVTNILSEYGVDNVAELSQNQRREFMTALDEYVPF